MDNVATDRIVALWRARRPNAVQTYQFPKALGLGHDIIDVKDPQMNVAVVYPKLLELIAQYANARWQRARVTTLGVA